MPAAGEAFWNIFDATGIRPEYLIPVLYHESGLNPAVPNGAGAPYYGIGQNGTADIQSYAGVDPQTYMTWNASQQLNTVVKGYFSAIVRANGPLHSGIRVYIAEFLPATLKTATSLNSVMVSEGDPNYGYNSGFDVDHKGFITPADLASAIEAALKTTTVQKAISDTYALRPFAFKRNPVYGTDFNTPAVETIKTIAALAAITWAASEVYKQGGVLPALKAGKKAVLRYV